MGVNRSGQPLRPAERSHCAAGAFSDGREARVCCWQLLFHLSYCINHRKAPPPSKHCHKSRKKNNQSPKSGWIPLPATYCRWIGVVYFPGSDPVKHRFPSRQHSQPTIADTTRIL